MPQLDSDAFTYSNGNLETVSGGKWTKFSGIGGSIPVTSNKVGPGGSAEALAVISSWAGSLTAQYSEVDWVSGDYSGVGIFGDGNASCYLLVIATTITYIYKVVAGSFTQINPVTGPAPVSGHTYRLSMSVAGELVATDNGSTIMSVSSELSLTSGKPCMRSYNGILDNWAAGDFSAGGGFKAAFAAGLNGGQA